MQRKSYLNHMMSQVIAGIQNDQNHGRTSDQNKGHYVQLKKSIIYLCSVLEREIM